MYFELTKGTPLGGLPPFCQTKVHVHPQLQNTISPPGHKLMSSEILTYPSDLKNN